MAPLLSGLLLRALELPPAMRYRLAFLIAESLGYTLQKVQTLESNYCQPDGPKGCARMTLKRWFGKCPDCPQLQALVPDRRKA